jgi:hypothetical protein
MCVPQNAYWDSLWELEEWVRSHLLLRIPEQKTFSRNMYGLVREIPVHDLRIDILVSLQVPGNRPCDDG